MINAEILEQWLSQKRTTWMDPPGCTEAILSRYKSEKALRISVVDKHRFAFYYWTLFSRTNNNSHNKPILITIDSHNDVGIPSEVYSIKSDLLSLDNYERTELAFFCWLKLRSLNDNQILPALYLDYFCDAFVLLNTREESTYINDFSFEDINNKPHNIKYLPNVPSLLNEIDSSNNIFLDIDLDFFIKPEDIDSIEGKSELKTEEEIRSFLSLESDLFKNILPNIVGITIATEPKHCGGWLNSMKIFNILNEELFNGSLLSSNSKWGRID